MKVLIIGESKEFQQTLVSIFSKIVKTNPILCDTASQGLAQLHSNSIDFICLSMHLGDRDGISFSRHTRAYLNYEHTPILLFTQQTTKDLYVRALSSGVTEVFEKNELNQLTNFIQRFTLQQKQISGRILYIEDDPSLRTNTKALFFKHGLEVNDFATADEAWQQFQQQNYDLVVTEIVLETGMTGMEIINKIRRLNGLKGDTPILALTSFDDISRRIDLFYLGMNDFVTKPLVEEELMARVKNLIKNKQLLEESEKQRTLAQAADKAKSEFLSNMSHEIRTPINGILGMAKIGFRESTETESKERFNNILNSSEHLLGVINDILDYSKIEVGKLSIESRPFKLNSSIEYVVNMMLERAENKQLKISTDLASDLYDWVLGDSLRLQQILLNFISNAIKFTAEGEINITVSRQGKISYFKISDTGMGINEEQISRLFTPFEQADTSTTRNFGGSGLGLAISYNLAHLMGGNITVESQVNKGSIFTLSLPLTETKAPEEHNFPTQEKSNGPQLKGLNVLVADDNDMNRLILEDLLEQEGATIVFAENGQQAIDQLKDHGSDKFDVILMDIQMPIMDGYEATRHILQIAPNLPIIGVTAHALKEEHEKCLAAGMVGHITKPFDDEDLILAIHQHI